MDKTNVFQVSVTTGAGGEQVHGIVFRDPAEAAKQGYAFPFGHLVVFKDDGSSSFIANDDGVLPYRERTQGDEEDLGLTWQLAK